ncbi:hypothetical protein [Rufibacter sp. XAAS-G3-1]|uniref:hypothetical protein n=1 Tax=Rufibacter sp. XAAS-G3-1 TaxID=2729134 RepID=UPI0015E6B11D|nr:hypothetical protein [Rufibacter sp. XAAS-G3-1]
MAKKKKKGKKHQSFYRAVKPFIKDNRVLLGLLGALGAGVALAKAIGPDKAGSLVDGFTAAVKHLTSHETAHPEEKPASSKKSKKLKEEKSATPVAIENT